MASGWGEGIESVATWRITLFGQLRIWHHDNELKAFQHRKAGILLSFLATHQSQWHNRIQRRLHRLKVCLPLGGHGQCLWHERIMPTLHTACKPGRDGITTIKYTVMLEHQVNAVIPVLRKAGAGLEVVALHHHMLFENPRMIFLHYYGTGAARELAGGFKAALGVLGKRPGKMRMGMM